jgi:hypothetical protein
MLRRVALVRTGVSEVLSASFIRVTSIGELGTALALSSNRRTLRRNTRARRLLVTASYERQDRSADEVPSVVIIGNRVMVRYLKVTRDLR